MKDALPYIVGVLIASIGAGLTYRATRKRESGSVSTTEAATLWQESSAIRIEALTRAEKLQHEVDELRSRLREVEDLSASQERELLSLRREAEDAHRVITIMQTRLDEIEKAETMRLRTQQS